MAEFSLSKKVAQDYLQSKRSFSGQSVDYAVPEFLRGLVAENGAMLASEDVISRAIQRNDPQGYAMVIRGIPDNMAGATIRGNTINYTPPPKGEDLGAWQFLASSLMPGVMNGAFSGIGAAAGGMPVVSPWAAPAGGAIGTSPLSGMAGNVIDTIAPASGGWGSGVGTSAAGAAAGGGMDLGFDMTGFMGDNPWSAGAPSSWQTLMDAPLGGGGVNFGSAVDPYGMGWTPPTPTGNAGWDSILSGGSNLPAGGPWNDFSANPYGSGVPSGNGMMDAIKKVINGMSGGGAASGAAGGAAGRSLFNANGELNMDALGSILGRAAPGLLGAVASGKQQDSLNELSREQMAAEKARYDDLVRRDGERFQTLMGREDSAIGRQDTAMRDAIAREMERFGILRQREDAAIGRQQEAMQFGRAVGQPSRDRYEGSFQPGFTMANDPGFMDALNQSSRATLNGLSVNGNPSDSPNAWAQSMRDNYEKVAYPALKDFRQLNATTGGYGSYAGGGASVPGIGTNLSGGVPQNIPGIGTSLGSTNAGAGVGTQAGSDTALSGIKSQGNIWNSLGASANNVFSPPKSFIEQLQEFKTLSGAMG